MGLPDSRPDAAAALSVRLGQRGDAPRPQAREHRELEEGEVDALGGDPIPGVSEVEKFPFALRLPEDLALFKRYAGPGDAGPTVGSTLVPRVKVTREGSIELKGVTSSHDAN